MVKGTGRADCSTLAPAKGTKRNDPATPAPISALKWSEFFEVRIHQ
jgi:hypothetical protein